MDVSQLKICNGVYIQRKHSKRNIETNLIYNKTRYLIQDKANLREVLLKFTIQKKETAVIKIPQKPKNLSQIKHGFWNPPIA